MARIASSPIRAMTITDSILATDDVLRCPNIRQVTIAPLLAEAMRRIHDGTNMGAVWRIILFVGGLLPAGLAVTGVIMWWRARDWPSPWGRWSRCS